MVSKLIFSIICLLGISIIFGGKCSSNFPGTFQVDIPKLNKSFSVLIRLPTSPNSICYLLQDMCLLWFSHCIRCTSRFHSITFDTKSLFIRPNPCQVHLELMESSLGVSEILFLVKLLYCRISLLIIFQRTTGTTRVGQKVCTLWYSPLLTWKATLLSSKTTPQLNTVEVWPGCVI